MTEKKYRFRRLTSFQRILLGFVGVIMVGTLLLMLPIASKAGNVTKFTDALFTATSAVCVTGLVVKDTATYWSLFGQSLILILIQIGGLGIVTVVASVNMLSGRKISLLQRSTMQDAISAPKVGGIVRLTGFILKMTFAIELIGALLMMPVFVREHGFRGVWMAFFHSVSAFCNAGFDIMGTTEANFASLVHYANNPVINIVVMLLIIIGGIGFLTWDDIRENKWKIKRYGMQTKTILITTAVLIAFPALYYYIAEYHTLSGGERIWVSLFQAITPRTAGFNTADLTKMSEIGLVIMIFLMLIGGSPGSTAGGMKTTTIAVLFSNAFSVFGRKEDTHLFGRRIEEHVVRNAATILLMYITLFVGSGLIISGIEKIPVGTCLFETASAIGTVGLTLGITPNLSVISQLILICLMFFGRVGGLTIIYAAFSGTKKTQARLPLQKITVG